MYTGSRHFPIRQALLILYCLSLWGLRPPQPLLAAQLLSLESNSSRSQNCHGITQCPHHKSVAECLGQSPRQKKKKKEVYRSSLRKQSRGWIFYRWTWFFSPDYLVYHWVFSYLLNQSCWWRYLKHAGVALVVRHLAGETQTDLTLIWLLWNELWDTQGFSWMACFLFKVSLTYPGCLSLKVGRYGRSNRGISKRHLNALIGHTFPGHGMSVSYCGPMETCFILLLYSASWTEHEQWRQWSSVRRPQLKRHIL